MKVCCLHFIYLFLFAIFVFNKRKSSTRLNDSERTFTDLKHEVLHGENKQELDLTGAELKALYKKNYVPGELSEEVTEYINNIIEERD